jgi:hypothetical protein
VFSLKNFPQKKFSLKGCGMILINMFLVIFCAYIAGELKCSIDIDRIENRHIPWYRYGLVVCNILASVMNMIVVVGATK